MLIDTHAHLDFEQFDADRAAVLERARAAGVAAMVNVGVYASVGVHPHDAKMLDGAALAELRVLAGGPKVVAVGEIGLDFYRDLSPRDLQRRAFQAQLAWAAQLGKPVIVHDREAHYEILANLTVWARSVAGSSLDGRLGVLHSFSGDLAMAERAIELGFYIAVSGPVTYHNARRLPEVVRAVPLDRLLVETDCPYLPPHPHRGQRNEPAHVRLVAEQIAAIRGITFDQVAQATTANACRLFDLSDFHWEEEVD
jgi:TatD DNase family protein